MNTENLKQLVSQRPFHSLRISLVSGESFTVKHPEYVAVGERWVAILQDPEAPVICETDMIASIQYLSSKHSKER